VGCYIVILQVIMSLFEQCKIWFIHQEYPKVIEALEENSELLKHPEPALMLMSAYISSAHGWKDRLNYEKVVHLWHTHEKVFSKFSGALHALAMAYLGLEQYGLALDYFNKAFKIGGPVDHLIGDILSLCRKKLTSPTFTEPYRARVNKAWKAFEEDEYKVHNLLEGPIPSYEKNAEALALSRDKFEIAMDEPGLRLASGSENGKSGLVFSPMGQWSNFFKQCALIAVTPQSIKQNWVITIGEPQIGYMSLQVYGLNLDSDDWLVWLGKTKKGYKLSAYCPKVVKSSMPKGLYVKLAEGFINNAIGELPRMKNFGKPDVLKVPRKSAPVPLTKLAEFLKRKGFDLNEKVLAYTENDVPFNMSINPVLQNAPDSEGPRHEIMEGFTSFPDLIIEYATGKNDIANDLFACGAVPGTIFFTPPMKGGLADAKNTAYVQKLQRLLDEKCALNSFMPISIATGAVWSYFDLIAWDINEVMRVARKFFRENPVRSCGFQVLHTEAAPDFWTKNSR
ncbi:MAG: hypothetical protein LUC43_07460, partial [Burkholderiales bacterium]|nr:hypothetical protein [Burkholderiales bacterium]